MLGRALIPAVLTAVLACLGPAPAAGQARDVNRVAAIVNGLPITVFDVDVAAAFGLVRRSAGEGIETGLEAVLEGLVDRKVVADAVRGKALPEPAAVGTELGRIAAAMGESWSVRLAERGLSEDDLRPYVEEKLLVERTMAERFGRSVAVGLKEIEARYQESYLPRERSAGREPKPLLAVVDALETEIRAAKAAAQAVLWVQNLREQAEVEVRPDALKR
jgi:hypothetical protein